MAIRPRSRSTVDAPIPIDIRDSAENNFEKVKRNIDFLWEKSDDQKEQIENISVSTPAAEESTTTPVVPPVVVPPVFMHAFNGPGGTSVDGTKTDLTLGTNVRLDSAFSHTAGSAEITILKEADYDIDVDAGFGLNEGDYIEVAILVDDGTGYVEIPGSLANCGA